MAKTVDPSMLIHEIIEIDPGNAAILMASGMHCVGCPSAAMESLEEACMVHGMNVDEVIARLRGVRCGMKPTSCPDQLAQALIAAKEQQKAQ